MDNQQLISELNRVKVLFQARTIALILGAEPPVKVHPAEPLKPLPTKDNNK